MSQTAVISARIDLRTKRNSEKILKNLGMTPAEAVRLLYRQITLRRGFPLELYPPHIPNAETAATLDASDRGEDIESFDNSGQLFASWEK